MSPDELLKLEGRAAMADRFMQFGRYFLIIVKLLQSTECVIWVRRGVIGQKGMQSSFFHSLQQRKYQLPTFLRVCQQNFLDYYRFRICVYVCRIYIPSLVEVEGFTRNTLFQRRSDSSFRYRISHNVGTHFFVIDSLLVFSYGFLHISSPNSTICNDLMVNSSVLHYPSIREQLCQENYTNLDLDAHTIQRFFL